MNIYLIPPILQILLILWTCRKGVQSTDIIVRRHYCTLTLLSTDIIVHWHYCPLTLLSTDIIVHWHYWTLTLLFTDIIVNWHYCTLTLLSTDIIVRWYYFYGHFCPLDIIVQWHYCICPLPGVLLNESIKPHSLCRISSYFTALLHLKILFFCTSAVKLCCIQFKE